MKLLLNALIKFLSGIILVGLFLFLPAGTFEYPNAWMLITALFIPMLFLGTMLLIKSPDLLRKRLNSNEKEKTQKIVTALSSLIFIAGFIIAALDFRFSWSEMSFVVSIASVIILLFAYALYAEVMRENVYLSRTVEVQANQKIIDTGLYGIVRHPMYTATIILFLSIPLVLGSWISFIIFCIYPTIIVLRIRNEEKVLEEGLEGYTEYQKKVKYKIIPFIW